MDEVQAYKDARFVASSESCWRLFGFDLHNESHSVQRLHVHLPDQQMVNFQASAIPQEVISRPAKSTLLAYFDLNRGGEVQRQGTRRSRAPDSLDPRQFLYAQIPQHFTWKAKEGHFKLREGHFNTIGRIAAVHPNSGERCVADLNFNADNLLKPHAAKQASAAYVGLCRFYLKVLLNHVKGATSFQHLRTVDGVVHPTFLAACQALGFCDDDQHHHKVLDEAFELQSSASMMDLFAYLLSTREVHSRCFWQSSVQCFDSDHLSGHDKLACRLVTLWTCGPGTKSSLLMTSSIASAW